MIFILPFIINTAIASSFITCDVDVKVMKANGTNLNVKILKVKEGRSGYGDCNFKMGQVKDISLKEKRLFEKGDKLKLKYMDYNGMGPHGVVTSKTWSIISK